MIAPPLHINSAVKQFALCTIAALLATATLAQPLTEKNAPNIKTVQLYRSGWEMSEPVIMLGSEEQLVLSFDELSHESKPYHFSIVHLSADGTPSQLQPAEYVNGFAHIPIDDYAYSFNTTHSYVHYSVTFPNDDISILRSGQYALKVYSIDDTDTPVITKYFWVTEQMVDITATLHFPVSGIYKETHQQLNLVVNHAKLQANNPFQEFKVMVRQNGRRDNMAINPKPDFVRPGELAYEYQNALLFEGGNEFRRLEIRSTVFTPEYVQKVFFAEPFYHVQLKYDDIKWRKPYFRYDESNGQYVVSVREYDNPAVNADYVFVHFSLPLEAPMLRGDVYVMGGLSDWQFGPGNKMHYNFETACYESIMLLKQGFYNYQYAFLENGKTKVDLSIMEDNHVETENDYHVFVYFHGPSDYADRLVGYSLLNSKAGIR